MIFTRFNFLEFFSALGAVCLLACLGAAGCYNSESEYQALTAENDALKAELDSARQENEILTRALDNINREQETLQLLLNAAKSALFAGRIRQVSAPPPEQGQTARNAAGSADEWQTPQTAAAPPPRPQAPPPRVYITKPGDVLSKIASTHHTTVDRILELNPNISRRRGHMIYDNERLRLP